MSGDADTGMGKRFRSLLKILKISGLVLTLAVYGIFLLWCVGAIVYTPGFPEWLRIPAIVLLLLTALSLLLFKPRRYFLGGGFALLIAFSLLWGTIKPTNSWTWAPEYERLPLITWEADNDTFTIRDIRDFHFRTTTDLDEVYLNDTFKFSRLKAIDFISVYWPQPCEEDIAHIMLRFRFDDGKVFLVSCETRRTENGEYGAINNLYKQSGMIYIIATEHDVLSLRTNIRDPRERVYIYEMNLTASQREQILRALLASADDLHNNPQFYNTLIANCYTGLLPAMKTGMDLPLFQFSFLASGRAPRDLYDAGYLKHAPGESFEALKERSYLNPIMEKWDHNPATYSGLIRAWEKENKK